MYVNTHPIYKVNLPEEEGIGQDESESIEVNKQWKELNEMWKKIPLYTHSDEAENLLSFVSRNPKFSKPSVLANLPKNSAPVFARIDGMFIGALADYRDSLFDATGKDLTTLAVKRDDSLDFSIAILVGAMKLAGFTPKTPVIKHVVAPILMLLGSVFGMFNQQTIIAEKKGKETSAHREEWLVEVQVKEKQRIEKTIEILCLRADAIHSDIQDLKVLNLKDDHLKEELIRLDLLMNHLSPDTPLKVNDKPLLQYLEEEGI